MNKTLCFCLLFLGLLALANGHGRLMVPPARSSAWRTEPHRFPAYYDDMGMYCGGKGVQWQQNKGKCGICGEEWTGPKRFEKGGDLYRGHIVRSYQMNGKIEVTVELTANHMGWFEFRLCNIDNAASGEATQECLDKTLLADTTGAKRFPISKEVYWWKKDLVVPANWKCNHCVFQWKYNAGNSHGIDPVTGQNCLGCGEQEQFYGCADISIGGSGTIVNPVVTQPPVVVQTTTKAPTQGGLAALWAKCGGAGFTGPTQCVPGAVCKYQDEWYSQCVPV